MWQLLGVFISGLALGSIAFLLRKLTRNRLGPWMVPTFAAAGIFGFLAVYDYTWYDNKLLLLPKDIVIVEEKRDTSFFRLWSYVNAPVSSFKFYDGHAVQDPSYADDRLMMFYIYEYVKNPIETYEVYAGIIACGERSKGMTKLSNRTIEGFKGEDASAAERLENMRKVSEWKNIDSFEQLHNGDPLYQRVCFQDF